MQILERKSYRPTEYRLTSKWNLMDVTIIETVTCSETSSVTNLEMNSAFTLLIGVSTRETIKQTPYRIKRQINWRH